MTSPLLNVDGKRLITDKTVILNSINRFSGCVDFRIHLAIVSAILEAIKQNGGLFQRNRPISETKEAQSFNFYFMSLFCGALCPVWQLPALYPVIDEACTLVFHLWPLPLYTMCITSVHLRDMITLSHLHPTCKQDSWRDTSRSRRRVMAT